MGFPQLFGLAVMVFLLGLIPVEGCGHLPRSTQHHCVYTWRRNVRPIYCAGDRVSSMPLKLLLKSEAHVS